MSIISAFAGKYSALEYWYGGPQPYCPPPIEILQGNTATGAGTIIVSANFTLTQGGTPFNPFVVGQSIVVGLGTAQETVTITSVGASSLVGSNPSAYSITVGGTFTQIHGYGDPVSSATFGLQEAVNVAAGNGGGTVTVTPTWYQLGGTVSNIQTEIIPTVPAASTQTSSAVRILDELLLQFWAVRAQSLSLVSAPSIPLSTQLAPNTLTGTFTAATYYFNFIYVTASGGLTVASSQYSVTCTANGVSGSGPIAATDVVGYLVASSVTTTTYINDPLAATSTGTIIRCGAIACFKIGTPFIISAPGTSALPLVPPLSTAFATVRYAPVCSPNMVQPFQTSFAPFTSTGLITPGLTIEAARIDLPTGYLNQIGRTIRVKAQFIFTPVSTAQIIPSIFLYSLYGTTKVTLWTITPLATTGTAASCGFIECEIVTAATGTTGTLEAHGLMASSLTTGTAPVMAVNGDAIQVVSSTVDLTKQDTLTLAFTYGTANITIQVRQFIVEILV